ncbi:STAS/SEC14 domain-containing protein [candidate division WOR-3 bacterium]|nr:STAS/SEC14 domain-containing protein [candidate division WOR-3 bacterium]
MNHKVHYNEKDKVAVIEYVGNISVSYVDQVTKQLDEILEGKNGRSVIADISESPLLQIGRDARMKMAEIAQTLNLDRIAIVGATSMNRMMAKVTSAPFGKSKEADFFKTKEEAISWLTGGSRE